MSRPATHDDLDTYARKGHVVATIPSTFITTYPSLGQHLLAALAEAQRLGLTIVEDAITIPLTADELDTRLSNAQNSWDYQQGKYRAIETGEILESWQRYGVIEWAKGEGLPLPTFDEGGLAIFPETVITDSDTGETLTPPLRHDDATALVAATTGRNVHVQAVTR